jgi:hypothetical protein
MTDRKKWGAMGDDEFWDLVGDGGSGDQEAHLGEIADRLRALSPLEVVRFCRALHDVMNRAHTQPLWAAAYIMCGAGSDEGFDCFKAWVILQGRERFEAALEDPDRLADIPEIEYSAAEQFLTLGARIHAEQTGKRPDFPIPPKPKLAHSDIWDFDGQEAMRAQLPRLWLRYGEPLF